ncbi:MAG TPA: hypothetical protein VER17_04790 [Tepidisphaeraceae bacterium]|nr:hypothetical protein [Tepidisphaeraceae bacterium]
MSRDLPPNLRAATADARLIGGLFVVLGAIPLLVAFNTGARDGWGARLMAVVNTMILVGPGVWYVAASVMMRRLNRQAVTTSTRVAVAQLVLVPATIVLGIFARDLGFSPMIFALPSLLAVFFIPALIALLFVLRRIRGMMNQIAPEAHGFEPLPMAVLPLEEPSEET